MGIVVGLVVGYVLGARTGGRDLEQLSRSLKALAGTDEFAEVVALTRAQLGHTLRGLASVVDRDGQAGDGASGDAVDLVDRVKHIVSSD